MDDAAERKQINCTIDVEIITWLGVEARTKKITLSECMERRLAQSFRDAPPALPNLPQTKTNRKRTGKAISNGV